MAEQLVRIRGIERYSARSVQQDETIIEVSIHGSRTRYKGRDTIIGTVTKIAPETVGPGF